MAIFNVQRFYEYMISMNSFSLNNFKLATRPINTNKLSIYYYNDTHGNSDEILGVINGARKFKNDEGTRDSVSFVLSAGDNYSGANVKKNKFFVDLMQNIIGVDASAIGNHEMDGGSDGFCKAAKGKKVDFIASNVVLDKNNPMSDVIKKSMIIERQGMRIGLVGSMPLDLEMVSKSDNIKDIKVLPFDETVNAIQNEINKLKEMKIDKVILLSHTGYEEDKKLASSLDGVDIIVGGHTHTVVNGAKSGENIVPSKSGEPVLIVQGGENGKYYGIINAEFNKNGVLKTAENTLYRSPIRKKSPIIEHIKVQNLGKSPKVGTITKIDPMPANRRIEHCPWTSTLADAMKEELGADIALINSANVRKVPQTGLLTENDISESVPMKNKLLKTKITQKQLTNAIKNSAKTTMSHHEGVPGLLQVSGLKYKIDTDGNLLELNFVDKNGKISPINIANPSDDIVYTVIYDDFAAKEHGEYPELFPQFEVQHFNFDKDKTMIDYLNKKHDKEHLEFNDDKRIEIVKTSKQKQENNSSQRFLNLTCPKVS